MRQKLNIDLNKARELYNEHRSLHKVCKHFNCSAETLYQRFKEAGIPVRDVNLDYSSPRFDGIEDYYNAGNSLKKCGEKYDISHVTARKILRKAGVDMRSRGGRNY